MRTETIGDATLMIGDCREAMRSMDAESVQCVVTSPPYWGLRDYGLPTTIWGSDPECEHEWSSLTIIGGGKQDVDGKRWQHTDGGVSGHARSISGSCQKCGAWRGCHGLEPTPEMYVEHEVDVFREVRRVLRDDGTVWLNLGDCYATGAGKVGNRPGGGAQGDNWQGAMTSPNRMPIDGLKPKDLVGIPWRVAFALQADGWYLRQDIIWHKPNPMPESMTDRCTKAHEYIFLLSKSARYYYDAEAIKELAGYPNGPNSPESIKSPHGQGFTRRSKNRATFRGDSVYTGNQAFDNSAKKPQPTGSADNESGLRNKRSVWTISTKPYSGVHFATFPPDLIEPCILAGSAPGDTVLDPFGGSGTVAGVSLEHGRKAVLCELSEEYAALVPERIQSITDAYRQPRLFADEPKQIATQLRMEM